jgi:hypothetical protein
MTSFPRTASLRLAFLHQKLTSATPLLIAALTVLLPQMAAAGAWTLGPGQIWSKVTVMSQSTDEHYDANGNAVEIPADAQYESSQVYFDVRYGVTDQIDLGLQIPYLSNKFVDKDESNDVATPPPALETESGVGDIRGFAKINLVNSADLVGTLKLGFKAPMGEYREVPEALSITGGQWDFDVVAQLGRSFWPTPMYANVDLGYRLRGEYKDPNPSDAGGVDRTYTPGAEFVFNAEAGYSPMDKLLVALKYESIAGAEYDALSNPGQPETLSQSVSYLSPTVLVGLHPNVSLEAQARMTVGGNRYFAGPTYAVGLSFAGSLIEKVIHQGTP